MLKVNRDLWVSHAKVPFQKLECLDLSQKHNAVDRRRSTSINVDKQFQHVPTFPVISPALASGGKMLRLRPFSRHHDRACCVCRPNCSQRSKSFLMELQFNSVCTRWVSKRCPILSKLSNYEQCGLCANALKN